MSACDLDVGLVLRHGTSRRIKLDVLVGWTLRVAPWGGYPGGTLALPGSGIGGFAHNPLMLEVIEESVVRSPFRQAITPPWFVLQRRFDRIAREFTWMEAQPNPMSMVKILGHALLA